jgi:MFS family permease
MTAEDKSMVSAAALWGAVMGQLGTKRSISCINFTSGFGLIADKIGRRKGFIVTLSLVILGAIASALSFETASANVFVSLSLFRFFLGVTHTITEILNTL